MNWQVHLKIKIMMCTDNKKIIRFYVDFNKLYSHKLAYIFFFFVQLCLNLMLNLVLTSFLKQGFSYVGVSEMMTGSNWNKQSRHWAQTSILQSLLLTTHKTLVSSGLVSCGWKFDVSCCFTLAYCTKQPQQSQHTTACKWKISTGDRHITITKCVWG